MPSQVIGTLGNFKPIWDWIALDTAVAEQSGWYISPLCPERLHRSQKSLTRSDRDQNLFETLLRLRSDAYLKPVEKRFSRKGRKSYRMHRIWRETTPDTLALCVGAGSARMSIHRCSQKREIFKALLHTDQLRRGLLGI